VETWKFKVYRLSAVAFSINPGGTTAEYSMKDSLKLTITSLLAILLMSFHIADDIVRGFEPGGFKNIQTILTIFVSFYGTLALRGRRSGYIIMLLGSMLGCLVSVAHMRGAGLVGGRIANSSGKFFWVWTVLALGVTALFSVVLSARGLWSFPWRKSRQSNDANMEV
jgi:hypothetical protein